MASMNSYEFKPDWAVQPGSILSEILEVQGISQAEFARRCGRSAKLISEIINGNASIEPITAIQFEKVLGIPANTWTGLDADYHIHIEKEKEKLELEKEISWAKKFPINDLVNLGIMSKSSSDSDLVSNLLSFFGVASISAFENRFKQAPIYCRESNKKQSSQESIFTWLRIGEVKTSKIVVRESFNKDIFYNNLQEIRFLTRENPDIFLPRMKELCLDAGVIVEIIKPFSGNKLFGIARWRDNGIPMIQMTLRQRFSDIFWFSFFHEAGHILLHPKKNIFIDEEGSCGQSDFEEQADKFAENFLILPDAWKAFINIGAFNENSIRRFADNIGIHPGIVLGRLQKFRFLTYKTRLNTILKERFVFKSI